jgi:GT2 family glycosyltransferase
MAKILGYSPYNQWMLHGLWNITILQALHLRGNDVKFILCDGLFSACDMHRSERPRDIMSCSNCQAIVANQASELRMPFNWLGKYVSLDEIKVADAWSRNFISSKFFQAVYDQWEIGSWIKSSVNTHFRMPYLDLEDPEISETVKKYLSSGLIACFAFDRLLKNFEPDILLLFNGRMSTTRIALELALKNGVRVITHERGVLKESLRIRKNAACSSQLEIFKAWNELKNIPLSKRDALDVKQFLSDRMYGKSTNWIVHSPPPEHEQHLRNKLKLDHDRPIFVLFNSSDDEIIASVNEPGPFQKQIGWIRKTIFFAQEHSDIYLIIRMHPNIAGKKASIMGNNFQQLNEILDLQRDLPKNARLIMPDDAVSSYTLMAIANVGLVYRSTAGLEMACMGKPVIVADKCVYSDNSFVFSIKSAEHYKELLESFLLKRVEFDKYETIRYAHRFANILFLRNSIPFPLIKMTNNFEGVVTYKSNEDLLPGKESCLERIMRIILEDEDIILPPKIDDFSRDTQHEDEIILHLNKTINQDLTLTNGDINFELMKNLKRIGWKHKFPVYSNKIINKKIFNVVENPDISIVVVSWRLHPDTIKNFNVLSQQRSANFELIFVNNGADENEFKSLESFIDTYVRINENTGPCFARNAGAVFSKAPILCFLEDDGIPDNEFVSSHVSAFQKYNINCLRGVYKAKTKSHHNQEANHYYLGCKPFPAYIHVEGNASIKSDVFFNANGWDEDIFIMADGLALSLRILQIDQDLTKQIYCPDPVIFHDYARSDDHLKYKNEQLEKSMSIISSKFPDYKKVVDMWGKLSNRHDLIKLNN